MPDRAVGILSMVMLLSLAAVAPASAAGPYAREVAQARTVYVAVDASTWMPRARTLADIGPTIRGRLAAQQFTVVRKPDEPHDLTVQVQYREERGRAYRVNDYGTAITCRIAVVHRSAGLLWEKTIRAESGTQETGTPPYLEALEDFQTNPYYYFLGQFVRAATEGRVDPIEVLIVGVRRLTVAEATADEDSPVRAIDSGHGMFFTESIYTELIVDSAIRELSRLSDPRISELLMDLLHYPSRRLRLAAVAGLQARTDPGVQEALQRTAARDDDAAVRRAASEALPATASGSDRQAPRSP
jgi:hypothetical protein